MISDFFLFTIYILLLFISILGYGLFSKKILNLSNLNNNTNFGELGFFSLIILIPLAIVLNFIFGISKFVSLNIFVLGIIFFLHQIKNIKNIKKIFYLLFLLIILLPYFILITHHDDFFYYHLPYLNVLRDSKIIFGLVNLNNVLAYPQNIWFNVFSLFRLPIIDYNGLQALNGIFTFFFIIFCLETLLESKKYKIKLISFCYVIFILALFSRLKDHGAEIIPQFLMLIIFLYAFILIFNNEIIKENIIYKILIMFLISSILRLSSIILLPFIIFILLINLRNFLNLLKKMSFIYLIIILISLILTKNIINSGCLVYPISITCFKQTQIIWSIDKEIPKINENVILSYTRGWMIYAKENIKDSNKFVFNPDSNTLTHKEYLEKGVSFWIKYWIKDPDINRILNIFLISLFIVAIIFVNNIKNFRFNLKGTKTKFETLILLVLLTPIIFWLFFSTPSTRYGGFAIFIALVSFLITFLCDTFFYGKIKLKNSYVILFIISISFFMYKNLDRLYSNGDLKPWPEEEKLEKKIDYKEFELNNYKLNVRLETNKLLMGKLEDQNNYILHCGNIKPLCTPIEKTNCINKIYTKLSYLFIIGNKEKCLELHSKHALY